MKNKAFVDNDDFVVVFKNCTEDLKQFLIQQYSLEVIEDFDAKPVKKVSVQKNKSPQQTILQNDNFNEEIQKSINKGLYTLENKGAFNVETCDNALAELSSFIINGSTSLNQYAINIINNYLLNRFKGIDSKQSSDLLTMVQCDYFVKIFGNAMNKVFIKNNVTQRTFYSLNLEEKRKLIKEGIDFFQKNKVF